MYKKCLADDEVITCDEIVDTSMATSINPNDRTISNRVFGITGGHCC